MKVIDHVDIVGDDPVYLNAASVIVSTVLEKQESGRVQATRWWSWRGWRMHTDFHTIRSLAVFGSRRGADVLTMGTSKRLGDEKAYGVALREMRFIPTMLHTLNDLDLTIHRE